MSFRRDSLLMRIRSIAGGWLLVLWTVCQLVPSALGQSPSSKDLSVQGVTITVEDLDRAVPFYRDALSFAPVDTTTWTGPNVGRLVGVFGARMQVVAMRLGDETIRLMEFRSPQGRPIPPDSRSNDLWFQHIAIVVSDMNRAYERVREYDVTHISPRPQTLPESIPAAAGISAFYFQDPTGNALELIHYPPDKGRDRWHRETEALFLGIDHTAIATADTEESLAFYRDRLGFEVAGESVNFGPEQERLTGVFGARVRITALRPPGGGIGIELLDYQAPSTGRPLPPDTKANDLWHGHVEARTQSPDALVQRLLDEGRPFVSPGLVDVSTSSLSLGAGAMVRGPSGHAVLLTTPVSDGS
jgi:catechol 2,3-dioxygenase-like lactoylglutathione lyase family enzyme